MNLKRHWPMLLAVVVMVCTFGWAGYGKAYTPEKAWEYKVVHEYYGENGMERRRNLPLGAKELSEYGSQGWELVSITMAPGEAGEKTFYFKRSK